MPTLKVTVGERDIALVEDPEYGLVSEWINGLDGPWSAVSDPGVIAEDDE